MVRTSTVVWLSNILDILVYLYLIACGFGKEKEIPKTESAAKLRADGARRGWFL
jgi:hypothetical protein